MLIVILSFITPTFHFDYDSGQDIINKQIATVEHNTRYH
jgi:hypothetical protein